MLESLHQKLSAAEERRLTAEVAGTTALREILTTIGLTPTSIQPLADGRWQVILSARTLAEREPSTRQTGAETKALPTPGDTATPTELVVAPPSLHDPDPNEKDRDPHSPPSPPLLPIPDSPVVEASTASSLKPPSSSGWSPSPPPSPELSPPTTTTKSGDSVADLASLIKNGSQELRVTGQIGRRENPFKQSSDNPVQRAERLARTLVSDMIAYAPKAHAESLQEGPDSIRRHFEVEIETARLEYYSQVPEDFIEEREEIFIRAVNDLLGNGQQII